MKRPRADFEARNRAHVLRNGHRQEGIRFRAPPMRVGRQDVNTSHFGNGKQTATKKRRGHDNKG